MSHPSESKRVLVMGGTRVTISTVAVIATTPATGLCRVPAEEKPGLPQYDRTMSRAIGVHVRSASTAILSLG